MQSVAFYAILNGVVTAAYYVRKSAFAKRRITGITVVEKAIRLWKKYWQEDLFVLSYFVYLLYATK